MCPGCTSMYTGVCLAILLITALGRAEPSRAQVLLTKDQALRLAFPEPLEIVQRTAFLSEDDLGVARNLGGRDANVRQRVVTYYVGQRDGTPVGVAYFDVHRVRTLDEALMFVVVPEAQIERIEILKFAEPPEYRAPQGWLKQFEGRVLSSRLSTRRAIVVITGATLTSEAVTRAARRILALHQVIRPFGQEGS